MPTHLQLELAIRNHRGHDRAEVVGDLFDNGQPGEWGRQGGGGVVHEIMQSMKLFYRGGKGLSTPYIT